MSKIMNSSYNAYSSGLSSFRNESTSDTSSFQLIPIHELVDAPDNGRYSVFVKGTHDTEKTSEALLLCTGMVLRVK